MRTSTAQHVGAYGLRITGIDDALPQLSSTPPDWPVLRIVREIGPPAIEHRFRADDAVLEYRTFDRTQQVGSVRLDRATTSARFTGPGGFATDAILHPDLGLLAAAVNGWAGRDTLHAGGFVLGRGAWAVLGAKEAGKSSLMAMLAAKGFGIVADDALVVDDGAVLAGPRCIDLRQGAAAWLGLGADIGLVGARRRWRLTVPQVPAATPLSGWIVPAWGERVEFAVVPPTLRLPLLTSCLTLARAPRQPARLLALAALPFIVFRRPRTWATAEDATARLVDHLTA